MPVRVPRLLAVAVLVAAVCPVRPAAAADGGQLAGMTVYALTEFRGTIYGGTDSGLVSLKPGGSWKVDESSALAGREIDGLAVAGGSTLIAATDSGAMRSGDGATWVAAGLGGQRVASIAAGADGRLYAGTGENGTTDGLAYRSDDLGRTWAPSGVTSPALEGLPGATVQAILPPVANSPVWAGTGGGGAFRSADGAGGWSPSSGMSSSWVAALWRDPASSGRILAGTDDGLDAWNGSSWGLAPFPQADPWVQALATGPDGHLLAGTYDGAVYAQGAGGAWTLRASGLPSVYSLLALPQGGILVGTSDGVSCIACPASVPATAASPGAHRANSAPTLPPPNARGAAATTSHNPSPSASDAASPSGAAASSPRPGLAGVSPGPSRGAAPGTWIIVGALLVGLAAAALGRWRWRRSRSA